MRTMAATVKAALIKTVGLISILLAASVVYIARHEKFLDPFLGPPDVTPWLSPVMLVAYFVAVYLLIGGIRLVRNSKSGNKAGGVRLILNTGFVILFVVSLIAVSGVGWLEWQRVNYQTARKESLPQAEYRLADGTLLMWCHEDLPDLTDEERKNLKPPFKARKI